VNHNNYYFLQHLTKQLNALLQSALFVEGYSTSKQELWLIFKLRTGDYFPFKFNFIQKDTVLSFPTEYHSPKHKLQQFKSLSSQRVKEITTQLYERSFSIVFENKAILFIKLFGKNGNVILFENEQNTEVFRQQIKTDLELIYNNLYPNKEKVSEHSLSNLSQQEIAKKYPFFPKDAFEVVSTHSPKKILEQLEKEVFYICNINGEIQLRFFRKGEELGKYNSPVDALNDFARLYLGKFFFEDKKHRILQSLQQKKTKLEKEIRSKQLKLKKIETQTPYKHIADILMANLHQMQKGENKVRLLNFYDNTELDIKLKKDLSPQENAENYYRKAKNQSKEIEILKTNLRNAEDELLNVLQQIEEAETADNSKELRGFEKENKNQLKPVTPSLFKEFPFNGYMILVGKNSKNNDLLTLKHAAKNDIWLHARGMAGSHVVIKTKAGQTLPNSVLEYAASLAAHFSKGKTDSLCPVIYTEKKYVRKIKGAPTGQVVVDKENTILVEPAFREK
jgi:predicted ribosome quality control (RQC) complex YloA/Tae2 family protein